MIAFASLATALSGAALAAEGGDNGEFDATIVSPGVIGFIATAALALAIIFLGFDLVRRVRRSQYRAQIREELAAELAEQEDAQPGDTPNAQPNTQLDGSQDSPGGTASGPVRPDA